MPAKDEAASQPEIVPSEQAVAAPPIESGNPLPMPAPPAAAPAPIRATWRGNAGEYLAPLLVAERDPANPDAIIEHIYYTPARDLDDNDWQAMTPAQRAYVRTSRLYDVATDAQVQEQKRAAK